MIRILTSYLTPYGDNTWNISQYYVLLRWITEDYYTIVYGELLEYKATCKLQ